MVEITGQVDSSQTTDPEDEAVLRKIVEDNPELSDFGYGVFYATAPAERANELQKNRDLMFAPMSIEQFTLARSWLAIKKKTAGITKRGTSYGLKHVAEHDIGYVTNGIFIAAAIAEGFQVQRAGGSPNAWFNISVKAWRR